MYNNNPDLLSFPAQNWGGMMRVLSSTANNLIEENIEFIEFWMKIVEAPDGAKINIDMGQINEDVIPNGRLQKEDNNDNDNVDEGEDTGIDGLKDINEPDYNSASNPDPNGDNFKFTSASDNRNDYLNINGTEGNAALTDIGRFPDSEDLNRNFTLDRLDSYFRYEISMDTSRNMNPFISGGGSTSEKWYQFRIPLKEFTSTIGNPSFAVIEFMRIWISGVEDTVHLRLADLNLVGNQWQKLTTDKEDSVMTLSTINIEDNPEYVSPPGVNRERDRSKPDQEVFKNEQSLQVKINDLKDGEKREAVKYLFKPLDLFNYGELKLFVRGDKNYPLSSSVSYYKDPNNYGAEIYFRFGSDTNNFYEYRQPIVYDSIGNRDGWNEIKITFDALTAIKERRDVDTISTLYFDKVPGKLDHYYGIKGNPTLTRVSYFTIGIVNPADKGDFGQAVSGEIWINELRVLGAEDTEGWAYATAASLKLADLMTVSVNLKQTDPYFHKLSDRFGSRVNQTSWGISSNLDVLKLIPANLSGSNLNVSYSHSEGISEPLYKPQTDVLVSKAAQASSNPDSLIRESNTLNVSDTWNVSNIKIKIPSNEWYIRDIINSLSFGFNYNKSFSRNPTTLVSSSWVWNSNINYTLNLGQDNFFYPVDIPLIGDLLELLKDYRNVKVFFTPQTFNSGITAKRNYSFIQSRTKTALPQVQRGFTTSRTASFNWKITDGGFLNLSTNYNININSSLAHLFMNGDIERTESEIWDAIITGNFFGRDNNYKQSFDLKTQPKLPTIFDINRYFTVNAGYNVSYNWQNSFEQESLGRSAGWGNSIKAGMNLKLKSLFSPLFGEDKPAPVSTTTNKGRRGSREPDRSPNQDPGNDPTQQGIKTDSTGAVSDSLEGPSQLSKVFNLLLSGTKFALFDYEQISFNFSQSNSHSSSGLRGEGTGFSNFWGIRQNTDNGPSRLYMLGLSSDIGPRALNGTLQDKFSQKNSIDFKTSRPLWEGATIDINWQVGWGYNESRTIKTDSTTGEITITNRTSTGSLDRTFFSLPIPMANSDLKNVNSLYNHLADDPQTSLSNAFAEGLETLPLLSKVPFLNKLGKYVPRPNWRINWSGLEKMSLFEGIAKRVSLTHAYNSNISEGWKVDTDGEQEIQTQKISYGFAPLLGVNVTFEELWGGNLSGSIKYSTKTNYDLGLSTRNITESFSRDINVSASFSKSGFDIPLFGLSLKNDLEVSFSFTSGQNSVVVFLMGEGFKEEGKPQDGTTRTTLEPRVRYVMSSRVTLSLFYRRTSVKPEGASRIPETTTNEAGLDVQITIQ
ncbi:MAG: cell surface protein SprA [Bacteroidetes bacterium]|nr:cell surface protein SprA [Bacteroidota bacterium]